MVFRRTEFSPHKPDGSWGANEYTVDFTATTGRTNRWHTNGGVEEVWYGDRKAEDRKLLTYTSEPLLQDIEITGVPIADIYVASDRTDGAFCLYLEDVDPTGAVRYITEGELRGIDRKLSCSADLSCLRSLSQLPERRSAFAECRPSDRTQIRHDADLCTNSCGSRHSHCSSRGGADTFTRIPETGEAAYTVRLDRLRPSHVVLPMVSILTAAKQ